jgi:toxin CcdB
MAQFKVYRNRRPSYAEVPYLLDVQSDLLELGTRLVIPLVRATSFKGQMSRLHPSFDIEGLAVIASTADLASVSRHDLRDEVASLAEARHEILDAIDFLLNGY